VFRQLSLQRASVISTQFHNAKAFNSDVSSWDVGNLLFGAGIFKGAGAFNHSLCSWRDKLPVGFDFDFDWNPLDVADMFHQSGCIDTSDPLLGDGSQSWSGPFCTSCVD
jgi:Mycoplasma protein of unknown function, DUF285